ncbi:hypothetical protein GCM10010170_084590 [Dactylosporangium salmoneum]|uniref:Transposase n=1 Tax=Dactylosporangium salmoneum TaxID=53361 RepID=A0ABN3HF99_9ACTN
MGRHRERITVWAGAIRAWRIVSWQVLDGEMRRDHNAYVGTLKIRSSDSGVPRQHRHLQGRVARDGRRATRPLALIT